MWFTVALCPTFYHASRAQGELQDADAELEQAKGERNQAQLQLHVLAKQLEEASAQNKKLVEDNEWR